jgi:two-component system, chemotaxis family, protein-glutamate methylesterase/glutaminase
MNARRIRVLIVDDSALVRKLVSEALKTDPEIEVVGTAVDPYAARDKIQQLNPDVITLDLEMPRMDGLTFLRILMEQRPLPVIVMSSLTQRGSDHACEALRLGAFDVLAKPGGPYSFGDLGPQLIARIKATAGARLAPHGTPPHPNLPAAIPRRATSLAPFEPVSTPRGPPPGEPAPRARVAARELILLGASTGGTEALREVLPRLPATLPGIVIVQHIPPMFSRAFAERLNELCAFEVREAVDGDRLRPGLALVAPGDFHLLVHWHHDHYRARVATGPAIWHQRPAIDLLFKSAADAGAGPHVLAGVFTGMGRDGADGLLRLRECGATTFAQDESSSVVYGMPRVAWESGAAQRQLRLDQAADFILRHFEAPASPAPPQLAATLP